MTKEGEARLFLALGYMIIVVGVVIGALSWVHGNLNNNLLILSHYFIAGVTAMWYLGLKNIDYVCEKKCMEEAR